MLNFESLMQVCEFVVQVASLVVAIIAVRVQLENKKTHKK